MIYTCRHYTYDEMNRHVCMHTFTFTCALTFACTCTCAFTCALTFALCRFELHYIHVAGDSAGPYTKCNDPDSSSSNGEITYQTYCHSYFDYC